MGPRLSGILHGVGRWFVKLAYKITRQQMHLLLNLEILNLYENTHNYRFYMFLSSTILRELLQSLPKVTLLLKHSVKLRPCILCGDVAACREMACVLFVGNFC